MNKYRIQVVNITEEGKHKSRSSLVIYSKLPLPQLVKQIKNLDDGGI